MWRKFNHFAVLSLTILLGTAVSDFIMKQVNAKLDKSYVSVLIGMAITVAVYYPLFSFLEKYIKKISEGMIKTGKSATKNSKIGLLLGLGVGLLALFLAFAYIWYDLVLL